MEIQGADRYNLINDTGIQYSLNPATELTNRSNYKREHSH
jgi:hypothetical protein